jgi:hypothetical protein
MLDSPRDPDDIAGFQVEHFVTKLVVGFTFQHVEQFFTVRMPVERIPFTGANGHDTKGLFGARRLDFPDQPH